LTRSRGRLSRRLIRSVALVATLTLVASVVVDVAVTPRARAVCGDDATIKSVGFALAFGVLVDAFVVRMTIVPAVMALLGDRAWTLPHWLDRIVPRIDIEGEHLTRRLEQDARIQQATQNAPTCDPAADQHEGM